MSIYTKTGDAGETSFFGGIRVSKTNARVEAYGSIDEANSAIGFAAVAVDMSADIRKELHLVMSDLLDIGSELSTLKDENVCHLLNQKLDSRITIQRIQEIEDYINRSESCLPKLKTFILPTGVESAARLHMARTALRRAERSIIQLVELGEPIRKEIIEYINRLSDFLFVLARLCNARIGNGDIKWHARKK